MRVLFCLVLVVCTMAMQPIGLPSFLDSQVTDFLSQPKTMSPVAELSDDSTTKSSCGASTVSMLDCEGLKKKPRNECPKEQPKSEQCKELKTYYECLIVVKSKQIEKFVAKLKSKTGPEIVAAVSEAKDKVREAKVKALKEAKAKFGGEAANTTNANTTNANTTNANTTNANTTKAANTTNMGANTTAANTTKAAAPKFFFLEKNAIASNATASNATKAGAAKAGNATAAKAGNATAAKASNATNATNGFNTMKPKANKTEPVEVKIKMFVAKSVEEASRNATVAAKKRVRGFVNKESSKFENNFADSVETLLQNYALDTHAKKKDPDYVRFKCLLNEAHQLVKGVKAKPLKEHLKAANSTLTKAKKEDKKEEKKEEKKEKEKKEEKENKEGKK